MLDTGTNEAGPGCIEKTIRKKGVAVIAFSKQEVGDKWLGKK
jgi:hypothetical protein